MADLNQKPLSFSTTLDGQPISIDGVPYLIKHPDSFSLRDAGLIEVKRIQIWKMLNMVRTDEQEPILEQLLREFLGLVTNAPPEAIALLHPGQLMEAAMAFMSLRSGQRAAAEAMQELMDALTEAVSIPGSPSSPDSPDSSEAVPGTGLPSAPSA